MKIPRSHFCLLWHFRVLTFLDSHLLDLLEGFAESHESVDCQDDGKDDEGVGYPVDYI